MAKLSAYGRTKMAQVSEPQTEGQASSIRAIMSDGSILKKLRYSDGTCSGWSHATKVGAEYLKDGKVPQEIADKWVSVYVNKGWSRG